MSDDQELLLKRLGGRLHSMGMKLATDYGRPMLAFVPEQAGRNVKPAGDWHFLVYEDGKIVEIDEAQARGYPQNVMASNAVDQPERDNRSRPRGAHRAPLHPGSGRS